LLFFIVTKDPGLVKLLQRMFCWQRAYGGYKKRRNLMRPNHPLILLLCLTLLVVIPLVVQQVGRKKTGSRPLTLVVYAKGERQTYRLDLEEYVTGVVAAEMPARFALEALKAQAVAARTLAIRRLKRRGGRGTVSHPTADFSDDPFECQAWVSPKRIRRQWPGWDYYRYIRKVRRAVRETAGIILIYKGQPIDAVYHSTCGGGTAAAAEIWPHSAPYLQATACKFDRHSPRYRSQAFFTWRELAVALRAPRATVKKIRMERRTASGRAAMVALGKYRLTGSEFRARLGLNSTRIGWRVRPQGLSLQVTGYGHGVGMCQYGADGLAKQGYNYRQILTHYYQGVKFAILKY
jgi:stage II sporulation protein D